MTIRDNGGPGKNRHLNDICLYGQMRSARFRYGIPASRPAPATEAVKTADNKKEDNRE